MKLQFDGAKMLFTFACLLVAVTASAKKPTKDLFPDGTEIPAWFRDTTHVDIARLGRQYRITDYGVMMDGKIYTQQLQSLIDRIADDGGGSDGHSIGHIHIWSIVLQAGYTSLFGTGGGAERLYRYQRFSCDDHTYRRRDL